LLPFNHKLQNNHHHRYCLISKARGYKTKSVPAVLYRRETPLSHFKGSTQMASLVKQSAWENIGNLEGQREQKKILSSGHPVLLRQLNV
jgi:hypothetical protein